MWFEEHLGPERAATMMNLIPPVGWFELASKHDLLELEGRIDGKLDRLRADLQRSFVTWLFASQAAVITAIGVFTALG